MMVNCPKCNFVQPKDQYCANCGIDMLSYRPAEKPFFQKLISNTVFQTTILLIAVAGIFLFVRYQQKSELASRVAEIENARSKQIVERKFASADSARASQQEIAAAAASTDAADESFDDETANEEDTTFANARSASVSAAPVAAASNPVTAPTEAKATATPTEKPAAAAGAGAAATNPSQVQFIAAEVPSAYLGEYFNDSRRRMDFGGMTIGFVPDLSAKLQKAREARTIFELERKEQPFRLNEPSASFFGDETSGRFLGFQLRATPVAFEENHSVVRLSMVRSLINSTATPAFEEIPLPLPESLPVPKGSGLIIVGALPNTSISSVDEPTYRQSRVLRVLTHETFRSNQSEFVIFVDLK